MCHVVKTTETVVVTISGLTVRPRSLTIPRDARYVLGLFALTQAVAALVVHIASQGRYVSFVSRWDGAAYLSIAEKGYGAGDGIAFGYYPLYPLLVRALHAATTLPVDVIAPALNLTASAAALVVLHRLVDRNLGEHAARVVVLLTCTWMAAPVLQMAYTEGLGLLLLGLAFTFLLRGKYGALMAVMPLLALSRALMPAFAAVVVVHAARAWRAERERTSRLLIVVLVSGALTFLWPVVVGIVTRDPLHYFTMMNTLPRSWAIFLRELGPAGSAVGLVGLLTLVWVAVRAVPPRTPTELRAWIVAYPLFIAFGTLPSGSIVRYLLFAFPMTLVFVGPDGGRRPSRLVLGAVAVAGMLLQGVWLVHFVGSTLGPAP